MPLDYENLTSDRKYELITNGHYFLKAVCNAGGAELANEVWTQLADVVSPVYRQEMLMHLLTGRIDPVVITGVGANKINAIKIIRTYTNLGLKESKDIVDAADYGKNGKVQMYDPRKRELMIAELRANGCTVL